MAQEMTDSGARRETKRLASEILRIARVVVVGATLTMSVAPGVAHAATLTGSTSQSAATPDNSGTGSMGGTPGADGLYGSVSVSTQVIGNPYTNASSAFENISGLSDSNGSSWSTCVSASSGGTQYCTNLGSTFLSGETSPTLYLTCSGGQVTGYGSASYYDAGDGASGNISGSETISC